MVISKPRVKLISITQPMHPDLNDATAEDLIVYCARVSNPNNQTNFDTSAKLLKYCLNHGHVSIFEQASMTVEIETSRAISAQILRHRSFCFQEFSQRYAEVQSFETYGARRQDDKNRQNSVDDMSDVDKTWFEVAQAKVHGEAEKLYNEALEMGIAKEQARFLLPMSTTSRLYMTGNVRSWIHYLKTRTGNGTQQEHIEIANMILEIFKEQFPTVYEAVFGADK